jgi:hypothetical protein
LTAGVPSDKGRDSNDSGHETTIETARSRGRDESNQSRPASPHEWEHAHTDHDPWQISRNKADPAAQESCRVKKRINAWHDPERCNNKTDITAHGAAKQDYYVVAE